MNYDELLDVIKMLTKMVITRLASVFFPVMLMQLISMLALVSVTAMIGTMKPIVRPMALPGKRSAGRAASGSMTCILAQRWTKKTMKNV